MKRLLDMVPAGTIAVGGGLGVLGMASYVHLAVAGHNLNAGDMSSLSVLWSIVFTLGLGLFIPVEQEVARLVAARRSSQVASGPVLARGATAAAAILVLISAVLIGAADPIAARLFAGEVALIWVLVAALGGLAVAHTTRGVLSGLHLFPSYGAQLGADGALRIALVAALGLLDVSSPVWYGLVLMLAPVTAAALTARPVLRVIGSGGIPIHWGAFLPGLGLLTVSSLFSQIVVNIGVINVRLLAPSDVVTAGALLSALIIVRIPLFVFGSLQASLLPGLAASVTLDDQAAFRILLRRALIIVTVLAGVGGALVILLGPSLVQILFNAPDVLSRVDFAWLAAGTAAYLWAMVLGQAVLAQNRHRAQALSWAVGTAALTAVTLTPLPIALRVEIAYTVGSIIVAVAMGMLLNRPVRSCLSAPAPEATAPPVAGGPR